MEESLQSFLVNYPMVAPLIFILVRSLAIIIPPISGLVIDLVGIITFGWVVGLIYAEAGVALGAMVAFIAGRRFRKPLVRRFVSLQHLHRWESELSEDKKFWYMTGMRLVTSPFFDYISYVAGLTTISTRKFILSTMIGTFPVMFAIYYFGGIFLGMGTYIAVAFILGAVIAGIYFKRWSARKYKVKD